MGKNVLNSTESNFISPSDGTKPNGDVSESLRQKKGSDTSSPFKGTNELSDIPTSSKSDSWIKGGDTGEFMGPDARRKVNFGSGSSK